MRFSWLRLLGASLPLADEASLASSPAGVGEPGSGSVGNRPRAEPSTSGRVDSLAPGEQAAAQAAPDSPPEALLALARAYHDGKLTGCVYCGGFHLRQGLACPRVRRVVGTLPESLTEIEFWREWDTTGVTYPEELAAIELPDPEPAP